MKKLLFMTLAAAGMLATSCQDYDPWDGDVAAYEYRKQFQNVFGNIDPNHTWNTAEQRTMEFKINVPGTFNLRIFTTNPKSAATGSELLANYTNNGEGYASGGSYTISFDCPASLRKVWADIQYVGSERHIIQQVEVDAEGRGKAVFGEDGTRATIVPTSPYVTSNGKKEIFTKQAYTGANDASAGNKGFMDIIPENEENTHKEEVHTDFVYVSTGETYHLYPIYIYTGADVTIGVQYRVDNESDWAEEITMLTTSARADDRITRLFSAAADGRTAISAANPYPSAPSGFFDNIKYDGVSTANATHYDGGHPTTPSQAKWATLYDASDFVGTLCDEILLNFPKGYEFRFWVEQNLSDGNSLKRYSDCESNPDKKVYFGTFNNGHKHGTQNVLYLGVEDWNNKVHDINDIVFAFVGEIPTIVDEGGPHYLDAEYLIAYEDMGTNDFDFNDIVVGVQHVSGRTTADVKIHACGGTLPVYLGFDDRADLLNRVCESDAIKLFDGKELHKALGGDNALYSTPLNVSGALNTKVDRTNLSTASCTMTVPETFSIVNKAQYFNLKVVQDISQGTEESNATANISIPSIGSTNTTPQAFLISYTNWEWPTENTRIDIVYPEFSSWLSRHKEDDGVAWYSPIWSGLDDFSSNVDYNVTLRPSYSFEYCLKTRDEIGTNTTISISKTEIESHNNGSLTSSSNFVMAFVVTNRQVNKSPSVTIYKNSVSDSNRLGSITFSDVSTTSTHSSYGEADKKELDITWSEITDIVVVFNNDNDENCKLNSIWAAKADKNIHMLDYEDLLGYEEDCNEPTHHHGDRTNCNADADGNCTNLNHHDKHTIVGKLNAVNTTLEVTIASASTNKSNFLVCNGTGISHQGSLAGMIRNAQSIATSANTTNEYKARFVLTVTGFDSDGSPIVSIKSKGQEQWLEASGSSARWSDSQITTFKICRATGGSRGNCIQGWDDDDMFRFQAINNGTNTGNYLNADGPKMANGTGEWSLWYMFEIINN